jgi:hypothetical protein
MGIPVIWGSVSSDGQTWWHKGARKRAGGKALVQVSGMLSSN